MAKRDRGTGSVWQPQGSNVWWCQFYVSGKRQRESTQETDKRKAINYLNRRLQEVASGTFSPDANKAKVAELVKAKLTYDRNNGAKSIDDTDARWKLHLEPYFGNMKAVNVTTALLSKYVAERLEEKAANGTINRELALLRSAYYLARKSNLIRNVPFFPMLREDNVRKGFLRDEEYTALANECAKVGLWLRTLFEVGVTYGWRRSELVGSLRVKQVDLQGRTIRLFDSKNGSGRVVVMTQKVYELLALCVENKKPDDFVFTWQNGRPVKDFRETWAKVTTAAGVPGLLFHDLRRTGVRNLRRLGVAESVAMKISGHRTSAVFRRYDIVEEADLAEAARLLDAKRKMMEEQQSKNDFDQRTAKVSTENGAVDRSQAVN